jgi:hypothetical protein
VRFSQFSGAYFSWLERLPYTQEAAASSPVDPAISHRSSRNIRTTGREQLKRLASGVQLAPWPRYQQCVVDHDRNFHFCPFSCFAACPFLIKYKSFNDISSGR